MALNLVNRNRHILLGKMRCHPRHFSSFSKALLLIIFCPIWYQSCKLYNIHSFDIQIAMFSCFSDSQAYFQYMAGECKLSVTSSPLKFFSQQSLYLPASLLMMATKRNISTCQQLCTFLEYVLWRLERKKRKKTSTFVNLPPLTPSSPSFQHTLVWVPPIHMCMFLIIPVHI